MSRKYLLAAALAVCAAFASAGAVSGQGQDAPKMPPCSECHSKNPKLVRMHAALEFKDCLSCHGARPSFGNASGGRMDVPRTERCARCHETPPPPMVANGSGSGKPGSQAP